MTFPKADYIAGLLTDGLQQRTLFSDWHNSLKLGYDVSQLQWPTWLNKTIGAATNCLPFVTEPGRVFSTVSERACREYGLPRECRVTGGTTDSCGAFVASGANIPGQAVTSLGSTLAIKVLSTVKVDACALGDYCMH
jgi:sugar (pentulose or hexulose) kinase